MMMDCIPSQSTEQAMVCWPIGWRKRVRAGKSKVAFAVRWFDVQTGYPRKYDDGEGSTGRNGYDSMTSRFSAASSILCPQGMSAGVRGVIWRFKTGNFRLRLWIRSVVLEDDMLLNQSTNRLIPDGHKQELGSMYCGDPNCEYCKQLREMEEQVRNSARRGA